MVNRENWLDVKNYLKYLEVVLQQDGQTVSRRREQLRHLLEWADETPLWKATKLIKPTFPAYLLSARNDHREKQPSPSTIASTCNTVKRFFHWSRSKWPHRYGSVSLSWIDTIVPPKNRSMQSEVKIHQFYSLEEMMKVAAFEPKSLRDLRDQAMMCFIYLSGMRVFAFVTLPINCIDLKRMTVSQLPGEGVHTKNSKAAITSLYPIEELLAVVRNWDEKVRTELPGSAMWYSTITQDGGSLVPLFEAHEGRREMVNQGIRNICAEVEIQFKSVHKLRHGHAVYGLKLVKDMKGLKSVSQNLMHSSVMITDSIYGELSSDDVHRVITQLKKPNGSQSDEFERDELIDLLENLSERLKTKKA